MKHYHKNPRQITDKQFALLRQHLEELGDLGGIVHDLNTDEIIGGNQRMEAINLATCQIEIDHQFDQPDEQGTVAHGYAIWQGKRYSYRQVRWTPKQCEMANIVANHDGGSTDFDMLANEFEFEDLIEWGYSEAELGFDIPEMQNDVTANTTKDGQYDKTKMPVNIGALLFFLSMDEQGELSENFGVFYDKDINDNGEVKELVMSTVGKLADEIRDLISTD